MYYITLKRNHVNIVSFRERLLPAKVIISEILSVENFTTNLDNHQIVTYQIVTEIPTEL